MDGDALDPFMDPIRLGCFCDVSECGFDIAKGDFSDRASMGSMDDPIAPDFSRNRGIGSVEPPMGPYHARGRTFAQTALTLSTNMNT